MWGVQCDPGPGPVLPVHGLHRDQTDPRHSGPDQTQSGLPGRSHGSVILCGCYIFISFQLSDFHFCEVIKVNKTHTGR